MLNFPLFCFDYVPFLSQNFLRKVAVFIGDYVLQICFDTFASGAPPRALWTGALGVSVEARKQKPWETDENRLITENILRYPTRHETRPTRRLPAMGAIGTLYDNARKAEFEFRPQAHRGTYCPIFGKPCST